MASGAVANPLSGGGTETSVPSTNTNSVSTNGDVVRLTFLPTDNKHVKDPLGTRFYEGGVNFRAKIIGHEEVKEPRGDDMCRESMIRLKAQVQVSGQHKQRIIINIDLNGIKIADGLTGTVLHKHSVNRISFIARDITDARAFGYVYGEPDGKHSFFAIKTERTADNVIETMRDLFQFLYSQKKKQGGEPSEAAAIQAPDVITTTQPTVQQTTTAPAATESNALFSVDEPVQTPQASQPAAAPVPQASAPADSRTDNTRRSSEDLLAAMAEPNSGEDYAAKSSNIMNMFGPPAGVQQTAPQGMVAPQQGMYVQQPVYGVAQPAYGVAVQQPMGFVQQPGMMVAPMQQAVVGMQPGFGQPRAPNPFAQPQQGQNTFGAQQQDPFSMFDNK